MKHSFMRALLSLMVFLPLVLEAQYVIPQPETVTVNEGFFALDSPVAIHSSVKGKEGRFLKEYLTESLPLQVSSSAEQVIRLITTGTKEDAKMAPMKADLQAYTLDVTPRQITVKSATPMGVFYGMVTLRQMMENGKVRSCHVSDRPRFTYRGLMIDCSRHFWSKDFILKQIDAMAYFKLDRLHLHLTDAGGWRIEIKKYPKLTEETAYRTQSDWTKWWIENDRHYCRQDTPGAYGGYYTQADLKEIVKYAAQRHIIVIPEIEMPGHSEEVCYAYPELSCLKKPYTSGDLCVGNEKTFTFLENVLKEVMKIFPSQYIHIGGDEASRKAWESCPLCQKRMQEEGLKTVEELQSYLTARIERYLNAHGRQLLGWDEILEGQLAPNAAVMSWRGEEGGIHASNLGHHVVMSPGKYCYLDHYQDVPFSQPKAIGGFLPLETVYSYDPVPMRFQSTKVEQYVDGMQGNLWTEFISTPSHAEYMLWPRAMAIAEVGWSAHKTTYTHFRERALLAERHLQAKGYHPFDLTKEVGNRKESLALVDHLARGCKVVYHAPYSQSYAAAGDATLTDGKRGGWTYGDGTWQGFIDKGRLDVTIDLGTSKDVHEISADMMQSSGAEVFLPAKVIIAVSDDGEHFQTLSDKEYPVKKDPDYSIRNYGWKGSARGRYIRFQALNGSFGGWIFTDEIIVQ